MSAPRPLKNDQKPPFGVFIATIIVVFFCALSAADSVGFVPYYIDGTTPSTVVAQDDASQSGETLALADLPELGEATTTPISNVSPTPKPTTTVPVRLEIPSIGLDLPVQNPSTTDVNALDALLVNGPARYVDSAKLGEEGNVVIFGHSSHLPIVHNKMFQAFNNVPNLKAGDSITLLGKDGKSYLYTVDSVVRADVNAGTSISLAPSDGTKLTIVTCDTLTGKSARFIMTASYVGVE